ncbi:16S rRNA (uracil(1498)-N(3))-methyltransferase [bacterium]|nr:MAG: 16S rRNA (uracil(1498)-N(3))-methyltransferase [bacterium]
MDRQRNHRVELARRAGGRGQSRLHPCRRAPRGRLGCRAVHPGNHRVSLPLRALSRTFVPGADFEDGSIELPSEELDKLRKVLRLSSGAEIAVLPNDGTLVRCRLDGRQAIALETVRPETEAGLHLTLAQALPKGDKLDEIVRGGTELGVSRFIVFPSERTVVRWEPKKVQDRLRRLGTIAREAAEVSFRTRLPEVVWMDSLAEVLKAKTDAVVLSEMEGVKVKLRPIGDRMTVVVGPEGGWAKREFEAIGDRGVTLGPRVLRVDHAGPSAAAILLLEHELR